MADQPTQDTPTSVQEPATPDTDEAIGIDASDMNDENVSDNDVETESPEETQEEAETPDEGDSDEAEQADEGETEAEADKTEEPEVDPKEEARRRYEERKARREENFIEQQRRALQEQAANIDPEDVRERLDLLQANEQLRQVEHVQQQLIAQNARAQMTIPVFRPNLDDGKPNPQFQEKAYEKALELYDLGFTDKIQYKDSQGQIQEEIIGYKMPLDKYLQEFAGTISEASSNGARTGQQAAQKMKTTAMTPPGNAPKEPTAKKDSFEEGFDSV